MAKQAWAGRLAGIALAVAIVGCGKPSGKGGEQPSSEAAPQPAGKSADVIKIGEYSSLTGSEATYGKSTHEGIMLAVNERNAAGGVLGKQIQVITYDDQGKSQEAGTAVTRLITQDKVVAVLGEVASSLSIAGGRVAQQYGVPMISPSSTNPQVTQIGDMVFRVCFIDPFQGYVGARFAREHLGVSKVAVLFDQGQAYSTGLKDDFAKAFLAMGGTILTEQAYTGGDQDYTAQLTTIRETNPELIYLPGYYTDVGNIVLQARKLGITVPFMGGDGWDSSKLVEIGREAIEGCYYSNHAAADDTNPRMQAFVAKYKEAYGQVPDALATLAYDAALVLFDAMERAGTTESKALARAIAETRDFEAITGTITIDENRNARKSAVVLKIENGRPVFVTRIEPPE